MTPICLSNFYFKIIDALLVELYLSKLGQFEILIKLIIEEVETSFELMVFHYEKKIVFIMRSYCL
jgi:hypothetical protein